MKTIPKQLIDIWAFLGIVLLAPVAIAQIYRPEAIRREINTDQYQLTVQKNGQLDLRNIDASPIVENAAPSVVFADGTRSLLKTDFRQSQRQAIRNPLGQGNGFFFESENAEWLVATYPTQPFLTIDLTYINHTKKPVEVARLCPLGAGIDSKGGVHLGPDPAAIKMLQPPREGEFFAAIVPESEASPGHLAAFNPQSKQTFLAGFITHTTASGAIALSPSPEDQGGDYYRFVPKIAFNPPITVAPGERVTADTLYIAIVERNPQEALERFALAAQRLAPLPAAPSLHCWQAPRATPPDQLHQHLAAASGMAPFGWTNIALGTAWAQDAHTYTWDPAWRAAFSANAEIQERERAIPALQTSAQQRGLTLSLTAPAPRDTANILPFLRECRAIGIDTVELATTEPWSDLAPHELFEALEAENLHQPAVVYSRPVAEGHNTLQGWALAARQYYLPPTGNPRLHGNAHVVRQDTSHFTDHQFITAWTLAAMQGALLRPTTPFTELSPVRRHILTRLLPAPTASARPLDLFQDGPPQRWVLRLDTPAGDWTIVALFNWEEDAPTQLDTPVTDLGLNNDNYYTVYDFWAGQYLGLIERDLRAEVPAEGVRLFGLRRYANRPMLIASNRHYTQGASDHTALEWSYKDQTLTGTFNALADTKYTLTVLVPDSYALKTLESTQGITEQDLDGTTLTFTIRPNTPGPLTWKVTCTTGG